MISVHFFYRLCDEATSALDSTTEAEILNALKSLANNRTSIFIAHRLTTAMQCDEVCIPVKIRWPCMHCSEIECVLGNSFCRNYVD